MGRPALGQERDLVSHEDRHVAPEAMAEVLGHDLKWLSAAVHTMVGGFANALYSPSAAPFARSVVTIESERHRQSPLRFPDVLPVRPVVNAVLADEPIQFGATVQLPSVLVGCLATAHHR